MLFSYDIGYTHRHTFGCHRQPLILSEHRNYGRKWVGCIRDRHTNKFAHHCEITLTACWPFIIVASSRPGFRTRTYTMQRMHHTWIYLLLHAYLREIAQNICKQSLMYSGVTASLRNKIHNLSYSSHMSVTKDENPRNIIFLLDFVMLDFYVYFFYSVAIFVGLL